VPIIADRRIKRNAFGGIEYPSSVIQKSYQGDIYLIDKKLLRSISGRIPVE
jgi:hypothetical protein